ncbi:2-phytyl-1,4-beta-naphthoquinone methyltransferase, chloroplastic [Nicotiana attenuata]|uniref:2-phytyl-1,4-beta-naphthoquinone methyltransferase, chloroplastic n=1 Tax=Nicotiana attenuata TaxID=49451 RepID=A0A1J6IW19_NICAT|nr:2-phytyl-1,4-beta-naphthoquinone methyltransferase, chloroplastic [Nicotiana attenuata]
MIREPPQVNWKCQKDLRLASGQGISGSEFDSTPASSRPALIPCKAVGLDFSKEQLLTASTRQKLRSKTCYKNIKWMEGNALDLPFPDSSFDAVTIGYGLRNVIDRHKAMTEICRVLKPGSTVSVLDFNKSINPLSTTIQELMIDNIVVPVASGYGLEDEYKYLKSSIKNFLTGNELEMLALEVGFSTAKHFEIGFGLMGNLVAIR